MVNSIEEKKKQVIGLSYQITDNQKISLLIRNDGTVLKKGKIYTYNCFNDRFYNDWNALEKI